jgi:hypothetical protein
MTQQPTALAVLRVATERPEWIKVLRAAATVAERSERFGGEFAGRWVLQEVAKETGIPEWRPGLRLLVAYGLLEKSGESTRGGRRSYYRMPDRAGVEAALQALERNN